VFVSAGELSCDKEGEYKSGGSCLGNLLLAHNVCLARDRGSLLHLEANKAIVIETMIACALLPATRSHTEKRGEERRREEERREGMREGKRKQDEA
jgi:hypothetical protein